MKKAYIPLLLASSFGFLSSCGGGGGGGSGAGGVPLPVIPNTQVTIANSNADVTTATSYDASTGLNSPSQSATNTLVGAVTTTPDVDLSPIMLTRDQLLLARSLFTSNSGSGVVGIVTSNAMSCGGGGSFVFTLNDADSNGQLGTGDTVSITYFNCVEPGIALNGGISLTNIATTGTPTMVPYSISVSAVYSNFQAAAGNIITILDGDITASVANTDGVNLNTQASGNSLLAVGSGRTDRLINFAFSSTQTVATGAYTTTVNATVDNNTQGGRTVSTTVTAFQGTSASAEPFVREALIT